MGAPRRPAEPFAGILAIPVLKAEMNVIYTELPGVLIIEPEVFGDERGFFFEAWNHRQFADVVGESVRFVQDNHSRSSGGVLRGLHYQIRQPQGKLVRAVGGKVFDVAVDIRRSSSHFGEWFGVELSAENKRQLWIPNGFAHGFYTMSERADLLYKATDYYAPEWDRSIRWNDPVLAIDWPLAAAPILSQKDADAPSLQNAEVFS